MKFIRVIIGFKDREIAKQWCAEQFGLLKWPAWRCQLIDIEAPVSAWKIGFYFHDPEHATMFKLRFGETV